MRKLIFTLICCMCFSNFMFSQDTEPMNNPDAEPVKNTEKIGKNFRVFFGFNAVNNNNEHSPFKGMSDWAVGIPISFGVESTINRNLVFEQSFSVNKFKETTKSNRGNNPNGFRYYSTSSNIKYFLDDLIKSEKFQVFASAGLGIFNIKETNTSGNFGGGLQYWINEKMAVRFKSIGKFAFKSDNKIYDNNHFQHHLELVFRL